MYVCILILWITENLKSLKHTYIHTFFPRMLYFIDDIGVFKAEVLSQYIVLKDAERSISRYGKVYQVRYCW